MRIGRLKVGTLLVYVALIAITFIYLYPFALSIANSFKYDPDAMANPLSLLPTTWTTSAYERLFHHSDFPIWFRNSAIVAVSVTAGRVFFNSLAGYALARLEFRGRGIVFSFIVGIMAVPGVVLLIPRFLVINQVGIYDTFAGLIVPLLVDATGVFIMKNFFESVPRAVEEAARIDGASTFRTFWSVVLPMARPAVITIAILSFQGSWNELSHFIVAARSPELINLTRGVAGLVGGGLGQGTQFPLRLGAAVLMTIPVAILFFIFQRRIMDQSTGAVKE
ncbi:MAG: carbohydrate ABC transporter permease [Promicromonosporaceae bacterium]|nr:carbohydrate ABC transporter permease [Promicromonosporaceae bacterium]